MEAAVKKETSGNRLLKIRNLQSFEEQYAKDIKSRTEIAKKLGDFCSRAGWYHSAAMYYRKGGTPQCKRGILRLVKILKNRKWPDTAKQIAILGNAEEEEIAM